MSRISFKDVVDALDRVDDPDIEKLAAQSQAVRLALGMARPRNWWGLGVSGSTVLRVAHEDGIPLTWVPRREVLTELVSAADPEARTKVLLAHEPAVLDDCETALSECTDPWLLDNATLARRALDAYRSSFHEAAMALAVSIGEPLALWASTPRVHSFDSTQERDAWEKQRAKTSKYRWAEIEISAIGKNIKPYDFKYQVLIAPVPRFFTPFTAGKSTTVPDNLSRHVVAHQPSVAHFGKRNALLSLMLVSSILREQQEWSEEVRASDEPFDES